MTLDELEQRVKKADEVNTHHWGTPELDTDIQWEVLKLIQIARKAGIVEIV